MDVRRRLASAKAITILQQAINTTLKALGYSFNKPRGRLSRTGPTSAASAAAGASGSSD